ncbi:MAG TPA: carboxypeptidase regulatory-like domain-containing protein [Gemmatimonadales bacterium]
MIRSRRFVATGGLRLLVLLCVPAPLIAQLEGTVRGTVSVTDGAPLALAQVSIVGTKLVTLTSLDGNFQIARVPVGIRVIHVGMVGYGAVMFPVEVQAADTVQVRVSLVVAAVALAAIEVEGEGAPFVVAMRGFEERRARGSGHYFNRAEIARMQARSFTDVLRRVPGVLVQPVPGPFETGETVRMSRTIGVMGARACPVLYFVNGSPFPVTGDIQINHYIAPEDVAAVEIYSGTSQIPPQFNSSQHNARCGVIVIWTLSGVDTTQSH